VLEAWKSSAGTPSPSLDWVAGNSEAELENFGTGAAGTFEEEQLQSKELQVEKGVENLGQNFQRVEVLQMDFATF